MASFWKLNSRGVNFEILKRQLAALSEFNERRRIFATSEIIRRNHLHRLSDDYAFAELHAALRHVRHHERHVGSELYVLNCADIVGEVNRALKLLSVAVDGEVGVFVNKHFGNFHIIENTHLDLRFSGTLIDHGENLLAVIDNGVPRKRRSTGKPAADALDNRAIKLERIGREACRDIESAEHFISFIHRKDSRRTYEQEVAVGRSSGRIGDGGCCTSIKPERRCSVTSRPVKNAGKRKCSRCFAARECGEFAFN